VKGKGRRAENEGVRGSEFQGFRVSGFQSFRVSGFASRSPGEGWVSGQGEE